MVILILINTNNNNHELNLIPQLFSAEKWFIFLYFLSTIFSLTCQILQRLLISATHGFMVGFLATLPWQTVRLHSDYKHLNFVWQPFPREGITIMFH